MRPALENLIGDLVDGKYRVDAMLGRGGMGAVFRAVHEGTSRTVALKVISPRLASEPEFLQRFQREARACGRLRHPNIVDVTDFGIASHRGEPLPYLVMEYLDGSSLADVLRQEANLPLAWCVDVIEQIGSAVDEAHRAGILHRDLKPDNIWLEPNRRGGYTVKVLDFGLAKLSGSASAEGVASRSPSLEHAAITDAPTLDGSQPGSDAATGASSVEEPTLARPANAPPVLDPTEDATLARPAPPAPTRIDATDTDEGATRAGSILGTPAYMAPEQCRGLRVDDRADVYSVGVVLFEVLTGRPPFQGDLAELMAQHLYAPVPALPGVAPELSEFVHKMLAKTPPERPPMATVAEVLRRLAVPLKARTPDEPTVSLSIRDIEKHLGLAAPQPATVVVPSSPLPTQRTPAPSSHPSAPPVPAASHLSAPPVYVPVHQSAPPPSHASYPGPLVPNLTFASAPLSGAPSSDSLAASPAKSASFDSSALRARRTGEVMVSTLGQGSGQRALMAEEPLAARWRQRLAAAAFTCAVLGLVVVLAGRRGGDGAVAVQGGASAPGAPPAVLPSLDLTTPTAVRPDLAEKRPPLVAVPPDLAPPAAAASADLATYPAPQPPDLAAPDDLRAPPDRSAAKVSRPRPRRVVEPKPMRDIDVPIFK